MCKPWVLTPAPKWPLLPLQSLVFPHPPREPQGLFGRAGGEDKNWPLDLGVFLPFPVSVHPGKERLSGLGWGRLASF